MKCSHIDILLENHCAIRELDERYSDFSRRFKENMRCYENLPFSRLEDNAEIGERDKREIDEGKTLSISYSREATEEEMQIAAVLKRVQLKRAYEQLLHLLNRISEMSSDGLLRKLTSEEEEIFKKMEDQEFYRSI